MKKFLPSILGAVLLTCGAHPSLAQDSPADSAPTNSIVTTVTTNEVTTSEAETNSTEGASNYRRGAVVAFGQTARSEPDHPADAVVAIGGSAEANGDVQDAVVAIFGDARAFKRVGDAVVAIFGDARAEGHVGDAVVAIFGNVNLGSNAVVNEAVAIGGTVTVAPGAQVHGEIQQIPIKIPGLPEFPKLRAWIRECVFELRLLSLHVIWPWFVAGAFLLVYGLVAVAFPRPVAASLDEITRRPATTFFIGLLTKILAPILIIVLLATGVGILVLPFLFAALLFAGIIGKVAMLQYLGGALTRATGITGTMKHLLAVLVGSAILLLLYLIPVAGFLAYMIFGLWGLGAAVTATFSNMSREKPRPPQPPTSAGSSQFSSTNAPGTVPVGGGAVPPVAANIPPAFTHPRAGFWERMGAAFLDLALLAIPFALLGPFVIPVAIAYFAGMWTWKGTTIGGLVLRQQVVRQNGEPLTFVVALVRCLAAVFSAFVLFLGFFWIGWNREKLAWHDLIAGTCVVRLPHAMPLVCF